MKMKKLFAICLVALSALISVHLQAQEVETLVLIDTDMGKIKVKLFNDTPQHRDNFIKNVKEHRYDGLLFHRVIKQFMVQAGDINSKDAPMEQHLGDGDLDYTIPAEIVYPKYLHVRRRPYRRRREPRTRLVGHPVLYRNRQVLYGNGARQDGEGTRHHLHPRTTPSLYAGRRHAPPGR